MNVAQVWETELERKKYYRASSPDKTYSGLHLDKKRIRGGDENTRDPSPLFSPRKKIQVRE